MKFLYILLTILGVLAVSAGMVGAQMFFAKKKSKLFGLIPMAVMFVAAIITAIVLLACNAGPLKAFLWFLLFYIPIIVSLVSFGIIRRNHLKVVEDQINRQNMVAAARHMEAERHRRLTEQLKHFSCSASALSAKEQQEIVMKVQTGKTPENVADATGIELAEINAILAAFERYVSGYNSVDNSSDIILTDEQCEEAVLRLANSTPRAEGIGYDELWNKSSARAVLCTITGVGVSKRTTSAYLRHFGFTVPAGQAIKARREIPEVALWIHDHYPAIRKKAIENGAEIVWIYQTDVSCIKDFSLNTVQEPVMISAVSEDGNITFRVYPKNSRDKFSDFVTALSTQFNRRIVAVVNENYHESMKLLGVKRREELASRIEFFGMD